MYSKKTNTKDDEIMAGIRVEKKEMDTEFLGISDSVSVVIQQNKNTNITKQVFSVNEIALCYMGYIQSTLSILEAVDIAIQKCKLCGIGTTMEERILCPNCIKKHSTEIYQALKNNESIEI